MGTRAVASASSRATSNPKNPFNKKFSLEVLHLCTEPPFRTSLSTPSSGAEQTEALVARNMAHMIFLVTQTKAAQ
jgi:hypothetical protein